MLKIFYFILFCIVYQVASLPQYGATDKKQIIEEDFQQPLERSKRSGKIHKKYHWKNATIPYRIDEEYFPQEYIDQIHAAMRVLENVTCIRFKNYTNERDFVTFIGAENKCTSMVGRRGGEQFIKLGIQGKPVGRGCFKLTSVVHELIHSIGFEHMHISPDRDEYITIMWDNIIPEMKRYFELGGGHDKYSYFGTGYDYASIMHYGRRDHSKNGKYTIKTIDKSQRDKIGGRGKMSDGDILRINRMYNCDQTQTVHENMTDDINNNLNSNNSTEQID